MTVGRGCLPNLVLETATLKRVEVKTEYLDYFTRNIQSFGSISIYVVSDIDETEKISLKISRQWKNNYLWVVDFVFILVIVCTCECWALLYT